MCFYEHYQWECNDWKWGNFRQHCQAEYRMGETCGMKLVYQTSRIEGDCKWCEAINKKKRRFAKAKDDYTRWANDPSRKASAATAMETMQALADEIRGLDADKQARMRNVTNSRRATRTAAYS